MVFIQLKSFFLQGLLSKWSKNNISNHLNINNQNRQVVIKCLYNRTNDKVKDQLLDKFYRESLSENFENNLWMNILTTLENASKIHVGNTTSRGKTIQLKFKLKNEVIILRFILDIIQTLDSIQLQDRGFICTIPNKIIQKNDFQRALDSLKVIAHDESKDKSVSITKTTMKNTNYLPALGYALLNLEKNEENNKLFAEVVNDLVKKSYYLKDEYDFLNYVWINESMVIQLYSDLI